MLMAERAGCLLLVWLAVGAAKLIVFADCTHACWTRGLLGGSALLFAVRKHSYSVNYILSST